MKQPRLLIVDDEEVVRDNVRWVMERQEWVVESAGNEAEASQLLSASLFDVVVADMKMDQDESGIEILRLAKEINPAVEVIILTAYGSLQNAARAMELGAFSYVEKNVPDVDAYQILVLKVKQAIRHKRLQEENRRLQAQLVHSERQATLGVLSSAIAHEVNNPLTGALGYTQMLMETVDSQDVIYNDLKMIEESALRCQQILRNIMDFARPDSGESMPLDVHHAIEKALTLLEREAMRKKIRITRNYCEVTPMVTATPNQISQVVMNLMVNAIQAMPQGGDITLHTECDGATVSIHLSDSGPGISPEHVPHLFDPFFSTKARGEGTGLGLYICQDIIGQLDGEISVASKLGEGTTFTVTLPVIV